jgi:hypothetical protein
VPQSTTLPRSPSIDKERKEGRRKEKTFIKITVGQALNTKNICISNSAEGISNEVSK